MLLLSITKALGRAALAAMFVRGGSAVAVPAGPLAPTIVVGHPFWKQEAGARTAQKIRFEKNLAMLGGPLVVGGE